MLRASAEDAAVRCGEEIGNGHGVLAVRAGHDFVIVAGDLVARAHELAVAILETEDAGDEYGMTDEDVRANADRAVELATIVAGHV